MWWVEKIVNGKVLFFLTDEQFQKLEWMVVFKKRLNLKNPIAFFEKLQWYKRYGGLEKYFKYTDKYEVRNYVEKTIGKDHLIPLLGVWDSFDEIDFRILPHKFVVKATHGSGYIFVCKDKSKLDLVALKKLCNGWLKENFYKKTREIQYKHCSPRIVIEKYMEDDTGELRDYKIYYFNGKPEMIQVDSNRFSNHKVDLMDTNWNLLPINVEHFGHDKDLKKPENLDELISIGKKLANGFLFVRVDLYTVGKKIYFGELTFVPGNGLERFDTNEYDLKLGEKFQLVKYPNSSGKMEVAMAVAASEGNGGSGI